MTTDDQLPDGRMYRQQFEKEVGFDRSTCSRWITDEVLDPQHVKRGRYWRQTFSKADVNFARGVLALLEKRKGELTLQHAAAIVRGELPQPYEGHDPKRSPR